MIRLEIETVFHCPKLRVLLCVQYNSFSHSVVGANVSSHLFSMVIAIMQQMLWIELHPY